MDERMDHNQQGVQTQTAQPRMGSGSQAGISSVVSCGFGTGWEELNPTPEPIDTMSANCPSYSWPANFSLNLQDCITTLQLANRWDPNSRSLEPGVLCVTPLAGMNCERIPVLVLQ